MAHLLLILTVWAAAVAVDEKPSAEERLEEKGIRTIGSYLALQEESDFSRLFRDAAKLKRDLMAVQREQNAIELQEVQRKRVIVELTQKRQLLQSRLPNAAANPVQYNQMAAAFNEMGDRINLLIQTDLSEQIKAAREKVNEAREAYVQHLLEMRKLADQISKKYTDLAVDPDVKAAIAELNKETGKKYAFVESRGFQSNLRNLKKLEDAVLSESIELRSDGSNTFLISVVFNGKHTKELVLDSGASLISLPHQMAIDVGVEPKSSDPTIILSLADGSMVEGRQITIPEVRVGKFVVEKVEGVVLPPELRNAPGLLGMSFLGNFDFKVDSAARKLTMTKVETEEEGARPRGRKP